MKDQIWASPQRGMGVQTEVGASPVSITGEVVQLYYSNSGTRTADAGQAAGTAVEGKFAYSKILNAAGSMLGTKNDSSLSFTSTAFTTQVTFESLGITLQQLEATDTMTFALRLSTLTSGMSNGNYAVDFRTGTIYGKKATTAIALTATSYKTLTGMTSINPFQLGLIGGGGAGGGNNTYSTEQGDFTAAVTNGTTNIVLSVDTVGGSAITAANFANGVLKVWDASTEQMVKITLDDFTWTAATKTLALANCTGVFTFATGDLVSLTLIGPDKVRDAATDTQKTSLIRDISDQYVNETLIDSTNVAAATNYYPSASGVSMDGYSSISIQGMTSGGVTTTIEATNDDASSPDWVDITKSFIDMITAVAGGASFVDVNFLLSLANKDVLNVKAIRIKSVTSDATNAVQYNIRRIY